MPRRLTSLALQMQSILLNPLYSGPSVTNARCNFHVLLFNAPKLPIQHSPEVRAAATPYRQRAVVSWSDPEIDAAIRRGDIQVYQTLDSAYVFEYKYAPVRDTRERTRGPRWLPHQRKIHGS